MADATSRPMKVPITFVPYLERYRVYELFQELLSRIIIKRPDDHLQFLKNEIIEIVQIGALRNSYEHEAKEESKGSKSSSSYSNKLSGNEDGAQRIESDGMLEDGSEEVEIANIEGSINYHMNEVLASMNEEEFRIFSEEVISNWRTIRRSHKFFNIRELPAYQREQEEKARYPDFSDSDTDEENNGSSSMTLIFHTRESKNEVIKESSELHMVGSANESDRKSTQSLRILDIKISTEETVTSGTNIMNGNGDEVVTVSYTETGNEAIVDKKESNEQIVQVKLLEGVPTNDSNEIKEYVMKLIKEAVEDIMLDMPKESLPDINLKYFQQPKNLKKMIHFPRGPIIIPRVVLLGPPASGKHLQGKLLAKALKLIHVDVGLLLLGLDTAEGKREIGKFIRKHSIKGDELMNDLTFTILQERLLKEDCLKNGWVLTGYPTTAAHAHSLDNMETPPNRIIYLDKSLEQCREILTTRMYDVDTGEVGFIQQDPPERSGIPSTTAELMTELENIVDIFGLLVGQMDAVSGYVMEFGEDNGKEGTGLFDNIIDCMYHRKRLLRSPEDDPKFIDFRLKSHAVFKSELLKYYGGWCTKLNITSQPPRRVQEAILSVVTGPFPSFEEAGIGDRTTEFRLDSIYKLGNEIESKLKSEVMNFFTTIN